MSGNEKEGETLQKSMRRKGRAVPNCESPIYVVTGQNTTIGEREGKETGEERR